MWSYLELCNPHKAVLVGYLEAMRDVAAKRGESIPEDVAAHKLRKQTEEIIAKFLDMHRTPQQPLTRRVLTQ